MKKAKGDTMYTTFRHITRAHHARFWKGKLTGARTHRDDLNFLSLENKEAKKEDSSLSVSVMMYL